jgi:hypothetical protein
MGTFALLPLVDLTGLETAPPQLRWIFDGSVSYTSRDEIKRPMSGWREIVGKRTSAGISAAAATRTVGPLVAYSCFQCSIWALLLLYC